MTLTLVEDGLSKTETAVDKGNHTRMFILAALSPSCINSSENNTHLTV